MSDDIIVIGTGKSMTGHEEYAFRREAVAQYII